MLTKFLVIEGTASTAAPAANPEETAPVATRGWLSSAGYNLLQAFQQRGNVTASTVVQAKPKNG